MDYRDRLGTITVSSNEIQPVEYKVRLAGWRPAPYQAQYRVVWPESQDIPGAEGKVAGDPYVRSWVLDQWDGGEGDDLWVEKNNTYDTSTNVSPKRTGDGLVLGAGQTITQHDGAADFAEGRRFGIAQGKLWAGANDTVHWWQTATDDWNQTGWTAGAGSGFTITSIIDADDGTNLYVGYDSTDAIYKVSSGANTLCTLDAGGDLAAFSYAPVLRNWGGTFYCLHGDDLYSFTDVAATLTMTARADVTGRSDDYLTNGYEVYNRLSSSDVGPIWYQRLDNGQTFIHEYNVNTQTTKTIGKLPVDFATPYWIYFTHGFYFVGFRYAAQHDQSGDAYVHFFRGAQKGNAGPLRSVSGTTASKPVLIGGTTGDDLIIFYDGAYWAYNLTSGGIYMVADSATTAPAQATELITFGQKIFLANTNNAFKVELADRDTYTTRSACIDSGRFDFGFPGITKSLLEVTVITEPLAASTYVQLQHSADGGTFVTEDDLHETEGDTKFTWTVSDDLTTVAGDDFELKLCLSGTASATPVIRQVVARAVGLQRQRVWRLEVDSLTVQGAGGGTDFRSADVVGALTSILESNRIVKFTNPWEGEQWDTPREFNVFIQAAIITDAEVTDEDEVPVLELREVTYV